MEHLKTLLITQARTGSTRLPGKVLRKIADKTLLEIHLNRLKECKSISQIVVATTKKTEDDSIVDLCDKLNVKYFRGSENDVLDRFYQCAVKENPHWIVRITADCPLIDPDLVDAVVQCAIVNNVDYCSNTVIEHFPDGQDIEVFKFSVLEQAWKEAKLESEKEHVTPYIRNNANMKGKKIFNAINFPCFSDFSKIRMTVDEEKDFQLISALIDRCGINKSWIAYTNEIIEQNLSAINEDIVRNEGLLKSIKND
ncbi:glycosyltransferase family protein [Pedobacter sp. UBA4863]|uniref:glycosyltransferase family protein n=1 Tax=Pedobacter sp. UBA4863 TaxID=1947060 RepID=UPI0025E8CC29|nr:glycosyltransferase family protein [Pedobacter sp. UBA4863]